MQLCLLHLDDALEQQPDFIRACESNAAHHIHLQTPASDVRLWGHRDTLHAFHDMMKAHYPAHHTPLLCFMGSGDFHHISTYLLARALALHDESATLIHFDNHPDWVKFDKGTHCGSWINRALEYPQVKKVITVGVCSHDLRLPEWKGANLSLLSQGLLELYPYDHAPSRVQHDYGINPSFEHKSHHLHWNTIRAAGEENFIDHLLSRIKTKAVYVTVDKDVLAREDAITNWDQGCMRLGYLLSLIKEISRHHTFIGADVTGDYSIPSYSGNVWTKISKHAEIFMDQPHGKPNPHTTSSLNGSVNVLLLAALSEAMA